jgi:heterogeneous nuclear ribonucleoprotein R
MTLCVCVFFSLQVKSLYVKNLPKTVTEEQLRTLFEHLGEITKVVLPPAKAGHENRYGFVHFKERHMAIKALKNTERYELDGELSSLTSFHSWSILLHVS